MMRTYKWILLFSVIPLFLLSIVCNSRHDYDERVAGGFRKDLKIATYNVHYLEKGLEPVRVTIQKVGAQVVALQEVLVDKAWDSSGELARRLNYYHASSRPYVRYGDKSWVLSFLSAYPIIKKDEKKLGSRKAFRVVIRLEDSDLTLVTTHLSPFVWSKSGLLNANLKRSETRKKEIKFLIQWIGKSGKNTIILGDLNSIPFLSELNPIFEAGFSDVFENAGIENPGTFPVDRKILALVRKKIPFFNVPDILPFDYIFISRGIKTLKVNIEKSSASDHYLLSTILSVPYKRGKD